MNITNVNLLEDIKQAYRDYDAMFERGHFSDDNMESILAAIEAAGDFARNGKIAEVEEFIGCLPSFGIKLVMKNIIIRRIADLPLDTCE